jgi:sodium transport system permease protein
MHTVITIFLKELRATLRDRKTLISAVLLPAIAIPLLMLGVTKLQKMLNDKENAKKLSVALINVNPALREALKDTSINYRTDVSLAAAKDSVAKEQFDAAISLTPSADSLAPDEVSLLYKSTNLSVERRMTTLLDAYKDARIRQGLQKRNLDESLLMPVVIRPVDVASAKEQIGLLAGGFLPYMFLLFCYMGCLYPAIDLVTGEKERGTIETLLTVPVSRFHILLGKMLCVSTTGVVAALMTIMGLFVSLHFMTDIPKEILTTIEDILSLRFILMLFAMLIPLSLFFAGLLSAIVVRASTFKEAQSYATPLMFVIIIPAMIALMPGMKLSWNTAFIPILNLALATKEIIAGTIQSGMYIAIVASLIVLAILAILLSVRQFSNEKNILK